ncbi:hypothetical protein C8J57DRAFT_1603580 [Mycena rebaudengoi]|nr:hypothetical protein C8J57DRAFT_1603580 [Mycena rebaudengoi]
MPIAVHSDLTVDGSTSSESSDEESESRVDGPFPSAEENDDDVEELSSEDFPGYFSERNGRLFHSHVNVSPYPLPVDTPEQERMNVQHNALVQLLGAHFPASCPVPDVLAHDPERQKYVLDLCTGTGIWTMEMAEQFPHVAFLPIATRYPLPNVQFTMQDCQQPHLLECGYIRLGPWALNLHGRTPPSPTLSLNPVTHKQVTSYATTLREVARLLRPGGLFLSGEWNRTAAFHPTYAPRTPETHAPAFTAFIAHVHAALTARGLPALPPPVPALLAADPAFTGVTESTYYLPIGAWHEDAALKRLGRAFRYAVLRYAAGMRPMFVEGGILSEEEMNEVYANLKRELHAVAGLVGVFRAVHARKV